MSHLSDGRSALRRQLVKYHRKVSHHNRARMIASRLITKMDELALLPEHAKCVDIGCGDMQIVELIDAAKPGWDWRCLDIYPAGGEHGKWERYTSFNGRNIPYADQQFDLSVLVDVLHHSSDIPALFGEAKRVSRCIIIKDHFEYGFYSSTMLKAMDLFGNWAYDIKVPGRYFTRKLFAELCEQLELDVVDLEIGMELYHHLPVLNKMLKPEWHFIAVLKSK
jgi:SAM-dependent methyltransferase